MIVYLIVCAAIGYVVGGGKGAAWAILFAIAIPLLLGALGITLMVMR